MKILKDPWGVAHIVTNPVMRKTLRLLEINLMLLASKVEYFIFLTMVF